MTIKDQVLEFMTSQGADYLGDVKVHDVYGFKNKGTNSNFYKFAKEQGAGDYVAIVGVKGRSAHSASTLHIFRLLNDDIELYSIGRDYFTLTI